MQTAYTPKFCSISHWLDLPNIRLHYRQWGDPGKPVLFFLHGWMDHSISFQFVADYLCEHWQVIAPDWRGFGYSDWPVAEKKVGYCYWFPDYLIDLECFFKELGLSGSLNIVGHSMGANVAMLYSGLFPNRVAKLVNLEGVGLPNMPAEFAPKKYRKWCDQVLSLSDLRLFDSMQSVVKRLRLNNPLLGLNKAMFLAENWVRKVPGGYQVLADSAHRLPSPNLYRLDEMQAIWAEIKADVLHVDATQADHDKMVKRHGADFKFESLSKRFKGVSSWKIIEVNNAGHMVHHDQPKKIASLVHAHCSL